MLIHFMIPVLDGSANRLSSVVWQTAFGGISSLIDISWVSFSSPNLEIRYILITQYLFGNKQIENMD